MLLLADDMMLECKSGGLAIALIVLWRGRACGGVAALARAAGPAKI